VPVISSILVAEDDPFIRRVAEVSLKHAGFQVRCVQDGLEALEAFEEATFDLLLIDGMMPRMDGVEACRRLRADPRFAHIPVILLSARSHQHDEDDARQAGATGYIVKPFDALTLADRILEIVNGATPSTAEQHGAR
jgi:CheY-like chemotaxis protein